MSDADGHSATSEAQSGESEPDYRFTLANERTFLAWQRTALGLLAAAVALVHLVPETAVPGLRFVVGGLLAALAILTSAAGLRRWTVVDTAMRRGLPLPRHRTPAWMGLGLVVVAVLCLALLALQAVPG